MLWCLEVESSVCLLPNEELSFIDRLLSFLPVFMDLSIHIVIIFRFSFEVCGEFASVVKDWKLQLYIHVL